MRNTAIPVSAARHSPSDRDRRALLGAAAATALACSLPGAARAQMRIDVSGVGATQYPIAIANFVLEGRVPQDVVDVLRADLTRSGAFRLISTSAALSDTATPDFSDLKSRGADAVAGGSVARLADGRFDIRFRLHDVVKGASLGGESFLASEADLRYAAHRMADWIYEKLTGERGIFATRVLFVAKQGPRYRLNVADWDGENIVSPLSSSEPIMSPAWSPDGTRLAYVSFESRKPVVYVHTLSTGQRKAVANFRGSNSAPAWSPDGRMLAVTLTREGLSQVFLINSDGSGNPRRLTSSSGIDTEPVYSPDGRSLYFTSDRGGSPQIYRMPADGGEPSRVTFGSSYNVSARPSPDGRSLAFITRRDGRYLVAIKNLATGAEQLLSDTGREESPSFSPNGRWIMFATQSGGRDSLMAVTVDGRVKQRLSSNLGDIREPSWGPFTR
ncbi:MAG TPA: Tol-Pal system beta propeller repeat protein TolB [Burkholderiaceae bacterium]|jgi:TolB protein|nr:Tol-Pal system beta propeller repeat protein TolB [Burkholderiaceae bacterium]